MSTEFKAKTYRFMLHRQVMVVARTRVEGTWKAYVFPVPGMSHDQEEYLWRTEGSEICEKVARSMFGHLKDIPYSD